MEIVVIIQKKWLLNVLKGSKWFGHIYTIFLVLISFVIFNATDMWTAFEDLGRLFGAGDIPLLSKESVYYAKSYVVTIFVGIIGCMPVIPWIRNKWMQNREDTDTLVGVTYIVKPILLIVLVLLSTAYLVDGSFNPFLYFRF